MGAEVTERCYSGAFTASRVRCDKPGVWTTKLGNLVDRFVWCDEHAPSEEWRVPVEERESDQREGEQPKERDEKT